MDVLTNYAEKAYRDKLSSVETEKHHENWLDFLPRTPGTFLDIGAASGRDANWFAARGWSVTAVESNRDWTLIPESNDSIEWIRDELPNLLKLMVKPQYDVILVSDVWAQLNRTEQQQALLRLFGLMKHDGLLVINWTVPKSVGIADTVDLVTLRKALIIESDDPISSDRIMFNAVFGSEKVVADNAVDVEEAISSVV